MRIVELLLSLGLIALVLVDAFETILQPRRVTHRYRLARFYYRHTWKLWRSIALPLRSVKLRESYLSLYGPLSLLALFVTWMALLIVGFALLHWAIRTPMHYVDGLKGGFGTYLYFSGTT